MDELGVKKLAEVEAFLTIGSEILKKSGDDFANSEPEVSAILLQISTISFKKTVKVESANLFNDKVDKTVQKLGQMMELYVGSSWDNPTEVLEWCSFYSGAGAAHCAIARGLSEDKMIKNALDKLQGNFSGLLHLVIAKLEKIEN